MSTEHDQGATSAVRTIGRYRAFDELGRGAMGVVYKGFDPIIGRTVALKTLALGGADAHAREFKDRLYREAAAAGALSHPGIVTIFDIVEDSGLTAVAMEFIEGRNLASIIEERAPLSLDFAIDVLDQLSAALDYAGANGIVHRDIKPANILLTPAGRVKVTDFGVARLALSTMTQAGTVLGSPSYMSPEQVRGLPLDGRSDLFSAVVVFYEMITRERPFAGSDVATTMYRIAHEPPTPPSQFNTAIGPELTAVLERALAKNPNDRFPSGAELVGEIRRITGFSSPGSGTYRSIGTPHPAPTRASTPSQPAVAPLPGPDETVLSPAPPPAHPEVDWPSPEAIVAAAAQAAPTPAPSGPDAAAPMKEPASPGPAIAGGAAAKASAPSVVTGAATVNRTWLIAGTAVAAVALVAVALAFVLRGRPAPDTSDVLQAGEAGITDTEPGTPPGLLDQAAAVPASSAANPIPPPGVPDPPSSARNRTEKPTPLGRRPAPPPAPRGQVPAPPPAASRPAPVVETDAPAPPPQTRTPASRGRVYEASQVDERPVVTRQIDPVYPPEAARRGIEDVVILKLVVLASGRVDEVQILRGSSKDPALDRAAIAAVQQWEFAPAKKSGAAVNSYFNVGVPFQLKK